uniref:ferroxidase n=1 Tax=Amphiprion ocellaris TaxID=80972 RepID=A0AAQ5ZUT6_AMPOC
MKGRSTALKDDSLPGTEGLNYRRGKRKKTQTHSSLPRDTTLVSDKAQRERPRHLTASSPAKQSRAAAGLNPDMRLCFWAGARCLLPVLVLLMVLHVTAAQGKERHYYIAAVEIDWNYNGHQSNWFSPTYKKVVFREYDKDFRQAKTHPSWLGLLGPTLRAEENETIVVTFRNMATGAYSIHPHGVAYGKQSEGANYFDNTSQKEKEDDMVRPNGEHVYYWEVTGAVSPQQHDPACLTYTYISHQKVVEDYNSGLIGTLLVCKPGSLDDSGKQVGFHQEYVFLFGVFDEKQSKYKPNGYDPDVNICAHSSVSLHLVGMSSEPEVFSVHLNGQVLQQTGHKVSSVGLISGSSATASMVALHAGRWLLSSHVTKHMEAGMHAFVDVKKCDAFKEPLRRMTIAQRRESMEWKYYIAAEEVVWDYTPNIDFKHMYLKQSATRIGGRYKKAVYTQYTNESFTEKVVDKQRKKELGILGPVIRAQIRDVIKIVFKNKASRPYSIYPHGLTVEKSEEGVNYPEGGNHSHGVQPGETHTYVWKVVEEDEPLHGDPRCLTRMYHSAVNTPRDIASGLIGPILICKSQSLNLRNVQLKADKEQHAMFAVFDENKSWYLDDNIRQYSDRSRVNKADPDFYKSNVMHTINGYMFESGPLLGFCNGEVATWHMSSIGAQDYIQTATFYGHPFELNERTEDFLSLYPMTGETITMSMLNVGVWLLASLNSHERTKGMRLKFQDVECYRDYQYEYDYEETKKNMEFTVWNPQTLDEIKKKEEEKEKPVEKETPAVIDYYTYGFAEELGLRSLKNKSLDSDMEQLDLSYFDYDFSDGDMDMTSKDKTVKSKPKTDALNVTLSSNWTDVGGQNFTKVNVLNPSITENTTHVQNISAPSVFDNSSTYETENTTGFNNHNMSLKNESITANGSASVVNNVTVLGTENTTVPNATALSRVGNVSSDATDLTTELSGNLGSIIERVNVMQAGDNLTFVEVIVMEDSEERVTCGDVCSYSVSSSDIDKTPDSNTSADPQSPAREDESNMTTTLSADGTNHSLSLPTPDSAKVNISGTDVQNLTIVGSLVESTDNNTSNDSSITAVKPDSSDALTVPANSSLENATHTIMKNLTVDVSRSDLSWKKSSEIRENFTSLLDKLTPTSSLESFPKETTFLGNLSISGASKERIASESSEEVFIYLQENRTQVIKSSSVKPQGHNWTYEGTHSMVPMEIPDHMKKYIEIPQTEPPPKRKLKKVNRRQRPQRGQGMKTKRRKEYQPQARSGLPFSLPFSPRGFNPIMTPRGSRPMAPQPVSDEEKLINMPVVIGVPRPDFRDYELYIPGDEPDHLAPVEHNVKADEYEYVMYKDPYSSHEDIKNFNLDETTKYHLKHLGPNTKIYFIAAEEVEWDYKKKDQNSPETKFTKVVFRGYMDSSFTTPEIRGELDEHLGILGPVIKAEVGQSILVVFRNKANRPYSVHPNGVSYTKQTEGLSYEDGSKYWYKYDNEVQPNTTFTYLWKVDSMVGPKPGESDCRTWAYYSGVNPERDIHSGLIGPLLVCREGTLDQKLKDSREFVLLFMTFDESQSWYYEKNRELMERKTRRRVVSPYHGENLKLHSINGIIYSLKGLRMYTDQLVLWHLINMGSPKDFQSVYFHGQTFLHKKTTSYRHAVYPLLPGSFATLEMHPSKPGLWQLETEVGFSQQKGMQTLFLVLDNDCYRPLGLQSGSYNDNISISEGYWEPHLARLNNAGKYNAWSTEQNNSWIQVDFQRPVVISQVATQGAKQMFQSQFVRKYSISYSNDRRKWIFYKGDSRDFRKVSLNASFTDAATTTTNTFFPPVIGRFIRLHPITWYNMATVRMEFYGCELDGCSVPLGMESQLIEDGQITASSTASSWYSGPWKPSLARLNKQGTINAWRAKYNDMSQWLKVELPQVKKITGIITQGAKSLGSEMFVTSYILQYSDNGIHWTDYTDDEDQPHRIFIGNKNNNDHVKNYIYPPIFSRFVKIVPKSWSGSITMRIELLGCDFE